MMKRLDLIERKLGAIKAKDVSDIVAKQVYLPFIGKARIVAEVSKWLARRVKVLKQAKKFSELEIEQQIDTLSATVCGECKDALTNELEETIFCEEDYETMVAIHLYRFSLGFYE